jgi:hypothetical protein
MLIAPYRIPTSKRDHKQVFAAVALCIRLPHGTLGDIVFPTGVQLAGAYAPAMLLLIMSNAASCAGGSVFRVSADLSNVDALANPSFSPACRLEPLRSMGPGQGREHIRAPR